MTAPNVLVSKQKEALPTAGADLLSANLSLSPHCSKLQVDFAPSVQGILTVTFPESSDSYKVYGGATLTAGALYPFEITVDTGETVNFQFSGTGGTYRLMAREV